MARPRRKSEAPKLRVIQGGAQALVSREARPRSERADLVASTTRKSLDPVAPSTPADEPEAELEAPTKQTAPASNQRKLMAVAIAFAAAVLVYFLLRRR